MENNLSDAILKICDALSKHRVEYIVVGGAAVALHGYFRKSVDTAGNLAKKPDLDIWYNPTYSNYFKLLFALEELGEDIEEFKAEQVPNPKKSFFKYEFEDFTLDFLPEIKAPLKFRSAFKNREIVSLKGIAIAFLSFEDLINDKRATSRPKDLDDIEHLKND